MSLSSHTQLSYGHQIGKSETDLLIEINLPVGGLGNDLHSEMKEP
jgi:hypothetical protein